MPHLSTDDPLCTVFYISKDVSSALLVVQPKLHFLSSSSTLHSSVNPIGFTSNMCLVAQCPTLCDVMDYSRPGSSVHGDSPPTSPYTMLSLMGHVPAVYSSHTFVQHVYMWVHIYICTYTYIYTGINYITKHLYTFSWIYKRLFGTLINTDPRAK